MNKLIQIALSLVTVLAIPALRAGDVIVPAKAPLQEAASEATGYFFAYGGLSLGLSTNSFVTAPVTAPISGNAPVEQDLDDGLIGGFGIGFYSDLFGGSRFEMEALLSSADYSSLTAEEVKLPILGDMKTQGIFLNVLKEFPLGNAMAYAGGGLGISTVESYFLAATEEGPPINNQGTVVAYQLKAGIDIPVSDRVAIFGEYKLIGLSDRSGTFGEFQQEIDGFVSNHFVVGGRLSF